MFFMFVLFSLMFTLSVSMVTWISQVNGTYITGAFSPLDPKLKRRVYSNHLRLIQDNFGFVYYYEEPSGLMTPVEDAESYAYNYADTAFQELNLTLNWYTLNTWRCT